MDLETCFKTNHRKKSKEGSEGEDKREMQTLQCQQGTRNLNDVYMLPPCRPKVVNYPHVHARIKSLPLEAEV